MIVIDSLGCQISFVISCPLTKSKWSWSDNEILCPMTHSISQQSLIVFWRMAELPLLSPNSIISVYFVASIHKIVSPDPRVPLFRAMPFILWLLSGILSERLKFKMQLLSAYSNFAAFWVDHRGSYVDDHLRLRAFWKRLVHLCSP